MEVKKPNHGFFLLIGHIGDSQIIDGISKPVFEAFSIVLSAIVSALTTAVICLTSPKAIGVPDCWLRHIVLIEIFSVSASPLVYLRFLKRNHAFHRLSNSAVNSSTCDCVVIIIMLHPLFIRSLYMLDGFCQSLFHDWLIK